MNLEAVFFDVDGVLLDSLPQHLAFCKMKAKEYGLFQIEVPSIPAFKKLVMSGVPVSPMINFFRAVGFPPQFATEAVGDYEREFVTLCPPKPFEGIGEMLERLNRAGFSLGLVTSNVRENVEAPLGRLMRFFDERCRFYFGSGRTDKRQHLVEGARILRLNPPSCVFVGDQPADAAAARAVHFRFLAVSYGWGFPPGETTERTVDAVADIAPSIVQVAAG
jgi:phosphoglycolate phosphatase-like HAD superfamily hydrolase